MKRILIIATLIIMSLQTMAQRGGEPNWISIAGKVGVGNSILLSEQIKDDGNITQNYLSPSVSVGGRLGVVFVDKIGVSVEYLASTYNNKYKIKVEQHKVQEIYSHHQHKIHLLHQKNK